jgi:Zn-dependent peptidase ImmA (M78 family)
VRRGFKKEANEIAVGVRSELGLTSSAPLNPWRLANHLEIPVLALSEFRQVAASCTAHFSAVEPDAFSAVTVFDGPRRLIVHNDSHATTRQASNLAHELAHGLLLHPPAPALDARGCREWDDDIEQEASWLAGALLIPEAAALVIARRRTPVQDAARQYGVSPAMIRFRMNVTNAYVRARYGR